MTMKSRTILKLKLITISVVAILLISSLASCGSKKNSATGALKRTQYCERYREFDEKVATADAKEQKQLLENIVKSKDFPKSPASLLKDYETVIEGYSQFENGTYDVNNQEIYKDASDRMNRHAIDNCEILKSNSGSKI